MKIAYFKFTTLASIPNCKIRKIEGEKNQTGSFWLEVLGMVLLGVDDDDTVVASRVSWTPRILWRLIKRKAQLKMTLLIFFTCGWFFPFLLCDGDHVQFGPS